MSMTGNEDQNAQAAPLPADDESEGINSETEQQSETARTPLPGMATRPTIKNN